MIAQLAPERDFRGPGCTDACYVVQALLPGRFGRSEILLHDPESHEQYGRVTSGPLAGPTVQTGSLIIDRWAKTVISDGRAVRVTPVEWRILDVLAAHAGRLLSAVELTRLAWDEFQARAGRGDGHIAHINVCRLRARLGENRRLIENIPVHGYRLLIEPPIDVPLIAAPAPSPHRWAKAHDRCVSCGTIERIHYARGLCSQCYVSPSRRLEG